MKAVRYNQFGGTEQLEVAEVPTPSHQDHEVLVAVKAASINPIDGKLRRGEMKMMSGKKFPQYVGGEFSGVVQSVGQKVQNIKPGDEVLGFVNKKKGGAMQELVVVTPDLIAIKPDSISFEQAASLAVVGTAAHLGLFARAKIKAGQSILINGCTGNMGMWATYLANSYGLSVTGVCSKAHQELAKQLGCQRVIDYRQQKLSELTDTYDVVFDTADRLSFQEAKRLLNTKGIFLNPTPTLPQIIQSLVGSTFGGKKHRVILGSPDQHRLSELVKHAANGFEIMIDRTFPLEDIQQAYEYAERGGTTGKVVVNMG
ncbi:NAD(P)-dependent alcohol dehydrogenase [Tunicatimonas pelagia]|uniref:NAD(P)-dependent alcohol dehydrogenase n=1 Tax=Tunicatimonas pelagia TaxID=931531 RepID=UPI002666686D|nr:NAD(P)-dependent alcohol dehydrogenase [Tunicatimonas pelagia]WKN44940.1 NAD(P)-dependent alcohol dehydrogenase [Tunicatimonas pelagia]